MSAEIHLSKLDVALRQLETAVTLYFHGADPVSVHTLTASAYNVLRNVKTHRGSEFVMFKDAEMIYPNMRKKYLQLINESENFFKHADRDADGVHAFKPQWTDFLLIDACEAYWRLTGERRPILTLYMTWFCIRNPQYYENVQPAIYLNGEYGEHERLRFFNECLPSAYRIGTNA